MTILTYDRPRGLPDSPPRARAFEQSKTIIEQETAIVVAVVAVVAVVVDFVAVDVDMWWLFLLLLFIFC